MEQEKEITLYIPLEFWYNHETCIVPLGTDEDGKELLAIANGRCIWGPDVGGSPVESDN